MKKTKLLSLNVETIDIWFRGKDIAKALGYLIPHKVIREHVDPVDRLSLECLTKGGLKRTPLRTSRRVQFL